MAKFSVDDIKANAEYIKNLKRKREKALKKEIKIRKDLIDEKKNDLTTIKTDEKYDEDEEKIRQMYLKLGILEIPEKTEGAAWLDEAKAMEREKLVSKASLDKINKILKGKNYLYIPYISFQGYRSAVKRETIGKDSKIILDNIIKTYIDNMDYLNIKPAYPASRIIMNVFESGRFEDEFNFLKERKSIIDSITLAEEKEVKTIKYETDRDRIIDFSGHEIRCIFKIDKPIKNKELSKKDRIIKYKVNKNRDSLSKREVNYNVKEDVANTKQLKEEKEIIGYRPNRVRSIDFTGHNLPSTIVDKYDENVIEIELDETDNTFKKLNNKGNRKLNIPEDVQRNVPLEEYNRELPMKIDEDPEYRVDDRNKILIENLDIQPIVVEDYNTKTFVPDEDKLTYNNNRNRPLKLGFVKLNNCLGVDEIVEKEKLNERESQEKLKSEYKNRIIERRNEIEKLNKNNIVNKKDPIQVALREHKTSSIMRKSSESSDSSDGDGDGDETNDVRPGVSEDIEEKEDILEEATNEVENETIEDTIETEKEKEKTEESKNIEDKSADSKKSFKLVTDFSTLNKRRVGDLMSEMDYNDLDFEFDLDEDEVNNIIEKNKNEEIDDTSINSISIDDILGEKSNITDTEEDKPKGKQEISEEVEEDLPSEDSEEMSLSDILSSANKNEEKLKNSGSFSIKDHLIEDTHTKDYKEIIKTAEKEKEEEINSILNEVMDKKDNEYDLDRIKGTSEEKVASLIDKIRQDVSEKFEDDFDSPDFSEMGKEENEILDLAEKGLNKVSENIEKEIKKEKPIEEKQDKEIEIDKEELEEDKPEEDIDNTKKIDIDTNKEEENTLDEEELNKALDSKEVDNILNDLNLIAGTLSSETHEIENNKKKNPEEVDKLYENLKKMLSGDSDKNVPEEYESIMEDLLERMKKDGLILKHNKNGGIEINDGISVPDIMHTNNAQEITLSCEDLLNDDPISIGNGDSDDNIDELITGLENINKASKEMPKDVIEFTKIRQTLDNMLENEWEITLGKRFNFVPSYKVVEKLKDMGLIVEDLGNGDSIVFFERLDQDYIKRRQDYYDFMKDLKSAIIKLSKTAMIQRVLVVNKDDIPKITNEEIELIKKHLTNYKLGYEDKYLTIDLNLRNYR